MNDFKAGDRVTWRVGHETMCGTVTHTRANGPHCIVDVRLDDSIFTVGGEAHEFTRIEKPQEWQGACGGCGKGITTSTACITTPVHHHNVLYACHHCWEDALRGEFATSVIEHEQQSALARSLAWVRERYPDDPRWQEVTT